MKINCAIVKVFGKNEIRFAKLHFICEKLSSKWCRKDYKN